MRIIHKEEKLNLPVGFVWQFQEETSFLMVLKNEEENIFLEEQAKDPGERELHA